MLFVCYTSIHCFKAVLSLKCDMVTCFQLKLLLVFCMHVFFIPLKYSATQVCTFSSVCPSTEQLTVYETCKEKETMRGRLQ